MQFWSIIGIKINEDRDTLIEQSLTLIERSVWNNLLLILLVTKHLASKKSFSDVLTQLNLILFTVSKSCCTI